MKETYDEKIGKDIPWDGNEATGGKPVRGSRVEEFIKDSLNSKAGVFYYYAADNRYLVFADEQTRDEYLADTTKTDLVLGTFEAPFNYNARIDLQTPLYNAVALGSVGNYLDFSFSIENKSGQPTGESVTCTYTIRRGSSVQTITERYSAGKNVHLNIDKYLSEGTNSVMIAIVGMTSFAATTVSVTFEVVNLQVDLEYDISQVHTSQDGFIDAQYSVRGSGTKTVEWYVDGVQLDYIADEDSVTEAETTRMKNIQLTGVAEGVHSLQMRAYTTIGGERFYSPTKYTEFIVHYGIGSESLLAVSTEIPAKYGIVSERTIYGLTQYVAQPLNFATYNPDARESIRVDVYLSDILVGGLDSSNGNVNTIWLTPSVSGRQDVTIVVDGISHTFPAVVDKNNMGLEELKSNLAFDFRAIGKSNSSSDKDVWSYGDITATFEGFEWTESSGWVNGRLKVGRGASVTFSYAPLSGKPTNAGKTIEFEFMTTNVNDDDAVICDLRGSNGAGLLVTATGIKLTSVNGSVVETQFRENENVRLAVVINRASGSTRKGLSVIYANGCMSRCVNWAAADSYSSDALLKFTGTEGAEIDLKAIRVYDIALSDEQVYSNYVLYRDTINEMLEVYERNDVFYEDSTVFSPEKMSSRLPVMMITGDIPVLEATSDKNTQIVVNIDYTNLQDPSKSFSMRGAAMRPQGTSSMGYPKKNFRIYSRKLDGTILYDSAGNVVEDRLYAFRDGAIPVDCWCLKADYAESSGSHNTGIARMWNEALKNVMLNGEYVCRTNAQKAAIAQGYKYDVRTAIDGFPILMFYRLSENDDPIFIGKYNFNNDKSTENVFGFKDIPGFDNARMQCWEILNNGHALSLFQSVENFDTAWKDAFESRYPDVKDPETADLKAFCTWMAGINGNHELFATEKWEHMQVYMMAAYYVYLMRFAAVDQFAKNAMLTSEDGSHFYFILYDNDTINGLINTGKIDVLPEDGRESVDASGAYKFAGHDSVLWNMLEADEEFMSIVRQMDGALYSAGISYRETCNAFDRDQCDKWVERVYNRDAQYKYIGPYTDSGVNNLFMLQGKRDLHRRWFLSRRFAIFDARWVTGEYKSQSVELKCSNGTAAGKTISITSGYELDYGYGINNNPREYGVHLLPGESHTFTTEETVNLGDPIRIYGAPNLSALDLSGIAASLAVVTLSGAYSDNTGTRLKRLVVGGNGINNLEVTELSGLRQLTALEYLDVRGMKGITSLDLTTQGRMTSLLMQGSSVASISLAKGAPLQTLGLSSEMRVLDLQQLPQLPASGIVSENSFASISSITVKSCPKVTNSMNWVMTWFNNKTTDNAACSLMLDNVNWNGVSEDDLIALGSVGTIDLRGKVKLSAITLDGLNRLIEIYGKDAFDPRSKFYINAPDAVFVSGKTTVLEGGVYDYDVYVFGAEVNSITWSIINGSNSYCSINSDTGELTVQEGAGNRTLTIRTSVKTSQGNKYADTTITIKARTYPSSSTTSIEGERTISKDFQTYRMVSTSEYNGEINAEWSLTGMEGYAEIYSTNGLECTLKKIAETTLLVQGTLSCVLTMKYNSSSLFTVTKDVEVLNDNIAETDPGICKALYDAGLCAHENYITKDEASLVVANDLNPGTNYTDSIFYAQRNNIQSFNGFKWFQNVSNVPRYCFFSCANLKSINFPEGLTSIDYYSFNGCDDLTSITIPESVIEIGQFAFRWCKSLTSVTIPNSVTSIGSSAFSICTSLTSIILPEGLTLISDNIFSGCSSLTSVNIPNGVTTINSNAFDYCTSLASINIPASVTDIGDSPFKNCGALLISVDEANSRYSSIDGVLFNKAQTQIIAYAKDALQPNYTIPNSVKSIGNHAFRGCSKLASITIPTSVTSIRSHAFHDCSSLTSITLPNSAIYIYDYAFYGCSSLTSINIPEGVTKIDSDTFSYCSALTSITIPASVTSISTYAFDYCLALKTITCKRVTAPTVTPSTFGYSTSTYTGYNTHNTGENKLYVPANATGYEESYWLDPLCNSSKCGFTLSKTL